MTNDINDLGWQTQVWLEDATRDWLLANPDLMAGLVADPPTMVVVPVERLESLMWLIEPLAQNADFYKPETPHYEFVKVPLQYVRGARSALAMLKAAAPTATEKGGG